MRRMSSRGLYALHLRFCGPCRDAEDAGGYFAGCPVDIHAYCGILADGLRIQWAGGAAPTATLDDTEGARLYDPASLDAAERRRAEAATSEFASLTAAGVYKPLSAEQLAGPAEDYRFFVSRTSVVERDKMVLPPPLAARVASGEVLEADVLARAAQADARGDAARYSLAAAGLGPGDARGHAEALENATASRRAGFKPRVVIGMHTTVNPHVGDHSSVRYNGVGDLAGGARPDDFYISHDMSRAYYHIRMHPGHLKYNTVKHPVTGGLYYVDGMPFGYAPACRIFSGFTAIIRMILRTSAPARQGDVVVTGYIDDIGQRVRAGAVEEQKSFSEGVYNRLNLEINASKTHVGQQAEYLGADLDAATATVRVKATKLYATLHKLFLVRRLCEQPAGPLPARVPTKWLESLTGDVGWLATFDDFLRVLRWGMHDALTAALRRGLAMVTLATAGSLHGDAVAITTRALDNRLRGQRYFPALDVGVVRLVPAAFGAQRPAGHAALDAALAELRALPQGAPAEGVTATGRRVTGLVSDASSMVGHVGWALMLPGEGEMVHAVVEGDQAGYSSDLLELLPILAALERHGERWEGSIVLALTDNVGNVYRLNMGSARGPVARDLVRRIYTLTDRYRIDLFTMWLPRSANSLLDSTAKCSTREAAERHAAATGLRFRSHHD